MLVFGGLKMKAILGSSIGSVFSGRALMVNRNPYFMVYEIIPI